MRRRNPNWVMLGEDALTGVQHAGTILNTAVAAAQLSALLGAGQPQPAPPAHKRHRRNPGYKEAVATGVTVAILNELAKPSAKRFGEYVASRRQKKKRKRRVVPVHVRGSVRVQHRGTVRVRAS